MKNISLWLGLVAINLVASVNVVGDEFVGSVPINEPRYESSQTGWLLVNATVFNAPCDLQLAGKLMLTNCGAGTSFSEVGTFNHTAKTPIILQVVDLSTGQKVVRYPMALMNGNNLIQLPNISERSHQFRLEVSYE